MMNKNTCLSIGLVFLIQLLSITFGGPVQFSLTSTKINSHPLLGRKLDRIEQLFPNITRFVTLSPKTEMAEKFHLRNGAVVFRENEETINYEYL